MVGDVGLPPESYAASGDHHYVRVISPELVETNVLPVRFSFDRVPVPLDADKRELGVIVKTRWLSSPMISSARNEKLAIYIAFAMYCGLVSAVAWHHEPWADEAHAWLLARDSGFIHLWTRLLHYEGSPGLWHSLLWALSRLTGQYRSEQVLSGVLAAAGTWAVLRHSPFPLVIRLLLPFTYFLCYQYAIVARSYALLPVLLFSLAVLFRQRSRTITLAILLILLSAVSAHGFLLSISIAVAFGIQNAGQISKRKLYSCASVYLLSLLAIGWSAYPAADVDFPARASVSAEKIRMFSSMLISEGFTGNVWLSLFLIALSLPYLYKGRALLLFLLSSLSLIAFGSIVYSQVWHSGVLFLAWSMALCVSAFQVRMSRLVFTAFGLVIAIQCYWTAAASSYDWQKRYSGSQEAAGSIAGDRIHAPKSIAAIGYSCSAIQAYLPRGIFINYPKKSFLLGLVVE